MIRTYHPQDQSACLELMKLNTPQFFDPSEEAEYVEYLEKYAEQYFVFEMEGQIVGCGGINFPDGPEVGRIAWDMVHPDFQGKGIGKQLTQFRINELKKNPAVQKIIVRTSQLAFPFYQKMGFEIEKIEKDFWAEGFDLYLMEMEVGKISF